MKMLKKIKNYYKENIFFSLKRLKEESRWGLLSFYSFALYYSTMYRWEFYVTIFLFTLSLFIDEEKTQPKLYKIYNYTTIAFYIAVVVYIGFTL